LHSAHDCSHILQELVLKTCWFVYEGYEAVVVCMGANVVMLPELAGKLTLSMCRGVVAQLDLPPSFL
jgi:hypothetical protein